jgi:hypothetical protein
MRAKLPLAVGAIALMAIGAACGSNAKQDAGPQEDASSGDAAVTDSGTADGDAGLKDSGRLCQNEDGGDACRSCCVNTYPNGALFFQGAIHACVCDGKYCSPACDFNYCFLQPMTPTMACATCALATLDADGGKCFMPVGDACSKNGDCVLWFQCNIRCK